ncbi:MAG: TIGR01440 family protein [Oscillospiraceae bacterium]|nr:TIGR01440 family protein [Oscillospiraceae bacterium]MBQ4544600.1 TIGR01440 family protein [Oscillospiraceae bacterium]
MYEDIRESLRRAAQELCESAKLSSGDLVAVGCSTSEVMGEKIGTSSVAELGEVIYSSLAEVFGAKGIYIAAQCCEHLNRALIVEREAVPGAYVCNAIPQPKAGGSFATAAYAAMRDPVAVETVWADAGMDIGDTLIGMHVRPVVVPCRLSVKSIGDAHLVCARSRAKFIGGERAHYDDNLK